MGRRLVHRLGDRFRIAATTHSTDRLDVLRDAGVVPVFADLDDARTLHRLGGLARIVVHLAPPPDATAGDPRTRRLVASLHGVERFVYVSTSGVYGDCDGDLVPETRPVAPSTDRARRRVAAEGALRAWAKRRGVALSILRVPGIYAGDRLPLARLAARTPVLAAADDVYTNHIHADDLAAIIVDAIGRGAPQRVYHASDDSALRMGDWFDLVADAHALPRPERILRADAATRIPAPLRSFMSESRRLSNARLKDELGVRLAYPTVGDGLATIDVVPAQAGIRSSSKAN